MNKNLYTLREKINQLDDKILDILDQRSLIVTKIGKLKDHTKGIVDESREQIILDRLLKLSKGKYSKDSIVRIWRELFEASSKLQLLNDSAISTKRSIGKIQIYKGKTKEYCRNQNHPKDFFICLIIEVIYIWS